MKNRDSGSMAVEALLLVPALFALTSFIVYVGRITDATLTVRRAADVAARVASQSSASSARNKAIESAMQELRVSRSGCGKASVQIQLVTMKSQTTVVSSVKCVVNVNGLGLLALAPRSVRAESTEIVDVYTAR
jgi:Flp pilus assembly protein TadG